VEMKKRLWGDRDHSDVAAGLGSLASLLRALGRLDEALSVLQASVDMEKRLWGDRDHGEVAVGLHNLAWLLQALGRLHEAKALAQDAVSMVHRLRLSATAAGGLRVHAESLLQRLDRACKVRGILLFALSLSSFSLSDHCLLCRWRQAAAKHRCSSVLDVDVKHR
jgi:hypothetical protein